MMRFDLNKISKRGIEIELEHGLVNPKTNVTNNLARIYCYDN